MSLILGTKIGAGKKIQEWIDSNNDPAAHLFGYFSRGKE